MNRFRTDRNFAKLNIRRQYRLSDLWKRRNRISLRRATGQLKLAPNDTKDSEEFFNKLTVEFAKCPPIFIVVLDETCAHYSQTPNYVLADTGAQHVEIPVRNEKETSSVLLWACANIDYQDGMPIITGTHGKPLVIFKGKESQRSNSVRTQLKNLCSGREISAALTKKGWMTGDLPCSPPPLIGIPLT